MRRLALTLTAAVMLAAPARAEVIDSAPGGFTVSRSVAVAAAPDALWTTLVTPARWWAGAHSWSGDAANFSLDPHAGGCFCEKWAGGEVEHARAVFVEPGKLLRLNGAFGPLQAYAVTGVLSFEMKPDGKGTVLKMTYTVGGYMPGGMAGMAAPVDGVLGEQLDALKRAAEAGVK